MLRCCNFWVYQISEMLSLKFQICQWKTLQCSLAQFDAPNCATMQFYARPGQYCGFSTCARCTRIFITYPTPPLMHPILFLLFVSEWCMEIYICIITCQLPNKNLSHIKEFHTPLSDQWPNYFVHFIAEWLRDTSFIIIYHHTPDKMHRNFYHPIGWVGQSWCKLRGILDVNINTVNTGRLGLCRIV